MQPSFNEEPIGTWIAIPSIERRVLGVLIEKAKTTPDTYPLTLNAIRTGCNQKSNRSPQMQLSADQVEEALDHLRELGAATEIQGDGRAVKFRHKGYQWLGVEKVELAVLAELLLRGEQTVGELRGRAARMESIDGLAALNPILANLKEKGLLVELNPKGRGQIVTHGLYPEGKTPTLSDAASNIPPDEASIVSTSAPASSSTSPSELSELRRELSELKERLEVLEAAILQA